MEEQKQQRLLNSIEWAEATWETIKDEGLTRMDLFRVCTKVLHHRVRKEEIPEDKVLALAEHGFMFGYLNAKLTEQQKEKDKLTNDPV